MSLYITPTERAEWRREASHEGAPSPVLPNTNEYRILRLLDQVEAPCGSCHPCDNWANQTWVNAGRRLPHLYEYEELERTAAGVDGLATAAKHAHKGPHDTDASMLREAAKRARGGYVVGGSNTQETVSRVLLAVADLLDAQEEGNDDA